MSAPKARRPDLALDTDAGDLPENVRFQRGDIVRQRVEMSEHARTHGTATVLEVLPGGLRVLVSVHSSLKRDRTGADWRRWRTPVIALVHRPKPADSTVQRQEATHA